jgi:hypothetical protein
MAHARTSTSKAQAELGKLNSAHLYSTQIQGAGKVPLPDGTLIDVSDGEQSGHPFLPSLQSRRRQARAAGAHQLVTARGQRPVNACMPNASFTLSGDTTASNCSDNDGTPMTRRLPAAPAAHLDKAEAQRVIEALLPSARSPLQSARRTGSPDADYFRSSGTRTSIQTSRVKEDGRMWLLLLKNQSIPAIAVNTIGYCREPFA